MVCRIILWLKWCILGYVVIFVTHWGVMQKIVLESQLAHDSYQEHVISEVTWSQITTVFYVLHTELFVHSNANISTKVQNIILWYIRNQKSLRYLRKWITQYYSIYNSAYVTICDFSFNSMLGDWCKINIRMVILYKYVIMTVYGRKIEREKESKRDRESERETGRREKEAERVK